METFLKQSIQAMKEKGQGHKLSDDLKLHIADIEKIPKEKIILTIEERIMVENMIEISKKIMTANNMNFLQEPPLNPNDIELYLDFYAGFLVRSNFIQHEDILPAFLEKSTQKRLKIMHELMNKYYIMTINMKDVSTQTTKNIYQRQSKEFFNEALKIVTRIAEGGKKIQKLVEKLNAAMAAKSPPKHVQELFSEHMKRLESTTQESTETNTLKSYLEWMVSIPYGVRSEDNLDIANVRKQLDSDHYGLDDVKDRILEFVAVGKMRNTVKEKILLLHGPPGVGKTSLAESVAK
jgi:Lon-like ATP-dependent protease